MHTHTKIRVHARASVHAQVTPEVNTCALVDTHIHACIHTRAHTHTHTHARTCALMQVTPEVYRELDHSRAARGGSAGAGPSAGVRASGAEAMQVSLALHLFGGVAHANSMRLSAARISSKGCRLQDVCASCCLHAPLASSARLSLPVRTSTFAHARLPLPMRTPHLLRTPPSFCAHSFLCPRAHHTCCARPRGQDRVRLLHTL